MASTRAKFASEYVGEQVRMARKSLSWDQADLVARLVELGFTGWVQTKVSKIEKGAVSRLSLDDVLALAAALDVQLAHLLAPDGAEIAIAPKLKVEPAGFRAWVRGTQPLSAEAKRTYYTGAIVPESEIESEYGAGGLTVYGAARLETTATIKMKGAKKDA